MKTYYLGLIGFVLIVAMVDCKRDSVLMSEPNNETEKHSSDIPTEGSVMYSELLKDNQLIEQSVDSLVNLGSKDEPAYFYVNLSHTVNNNLVSENQINNCAFYSVALEDLEKFISMYAKSQSLFSGIIMTTEEKHSAYHHLYKFLLENKIDAAQLVAMTLQNPSILNSTLESGNLEPEKGPQYIDPTDPNLPDELAPHVFPLESKGDAVLDSLLEHIVLLRNGIRFPFDIEIEDDTNASGPDPYNTNTYVSYINDTDNDSRNYYDEKTFKSPIYTCRYGTKGCPMVESEFHIEGWYNSKRKGDTKDILYVPYLKTFINNIHVGVTMHLDGTVTYTQPDIRNSEANEYPVIGGGEVVIKYGDDGAVKRVGRLKFTVDGKTGYKEDYWDNKE